MPKVEKVKELKTVNTPITHRQIDFEESLSEEDKLIVKKIRRTPQSMVSSLLRRVTPAKANQSQASEAEQTIGATGSTGTFVTARGQPQTAANVSTMASKIVMPLPALNIEPYSGRDDPRAFVTFLKQFRRLCNIHNVAEGDRIRRLEAFLTGDAEQVFEALPNYIKTDWEMSMHELSKAFSSGNREVPNREKFQNRRLREGESLHTFLAELRNLLDLAHPASATSETTREKLLQQQFIRGLPATLRQALYYKGQDKGRADEVLRNAQEVKEYLDNDGTKTEAVQAVEIVKDQLESIAEAVNNIRIGQDPRPARGNGQQEQWRRPSGWSRPVPQRWSNQGPRRPQFQGRPPFQGQFEQRAYGRQFQQRTPFGRPPQPFKHQQHQRRPTAFGQNDRYQPDTQRTTNPTPFQRQERRINHVGWTPMLSIAVALMTLVTQCDGYQICPHSTSAVLVAPPHHEDCTVPVTQGVERVTGKLYVPHITSSFYPAYGCHNVTTIICENHIMGYETSRETYHYRKGIDTSECRDLIRKKDELKLVKTGRWQQPTKIEAPAHWFGRQCQTSAFVEIIQGHVIGDRNGKYVSSDLADMGGALLTDEAFQGLNQTVIWGMDEKIGWCSHIEGGKFQGYRTAEIILFDSIQAAFGINTEGGHAPECLPEGVIALTNNVFFLQEDTQTRKKREYQLQGLQPRARNVTITGAATNQSTTTTLPATTTHTPAIPTTRATVATTRQTVTTRTPAAVTTRPTTATTTPTPIPTTARATAKTTVITPRLATTKTTTMRPTIKADAKTTRPTTTTARTTATRTTTRPAGAVPSTTTSGPTPKLVTQEEVKLTVLLPRNAANLQEPLPRTLPPRPWYTTTTQAPKIAQTQATLLGNEVKEDKQPEEIEKPTEDHSKDEDINVKLQYLEALMQRQIRQSFTHLWSQICNLHNAQIDLISGLMEVDPTIAVRTWLRRTTLTAQRQGEAIRVARCISVTPEIVFYNHTINGKCYKDVPIRIQNRTLFASGVNQELAPTSTEVNCPYTPPPRYWKDDQGRWISATGQVHVADMSSFFALTLDNTPIIFNSSSIFQTEWGQIASHVALADFGKRINRDDADSELRQYVEKEDTQNVLQQFLNGIVDTVNKTTNGTGSFVTDKFNSIRDIFKEIDGDLKLIIFGAVLPITLFGIILYVTCFYVPAKRPVHINYVEVPTAPPEPTPYSFQLPPSYMAVGYQSSGFSSLVIPTSVTLPGGKATVAAHLDTGSTFNLGSVAFLKKVAKAAVRLDLGNPQRKLATASGHYIIPVGRIQVTLHWGAGSKEVEIYIVKELPCSLILGLDFYGFEEITLRLARMEIEVKVPKGPLGDREIIKITKCEECEARREHYEQTEIPEEEKDGIDPLSYSKNQDPAKHPLKGRWRYLDKAFVNCINQTGGVLPVVPLQVNGKQVNSLIDTGSSITYMRLSTATELGIEWVETETPKATVANGAPLHFLGSAQVVIIIDGKTVEISVLISEDHNCPRPLLLGNDAMAELSRQGMNVEFDFAQSRVKLGEQNWYINMIELDAEEEDQTRKVHISSDVTLEPRSTTFFWAKTAVDHNSDYLALDAIGETPDLITMAGIVARPTVDGRFPIQVLNSGMNQVTLPHGKVIARLESLSTRPQEEVMAIAGNPTQHPVHIAEEVDIGEQLPDPPAKQPKDLLSQLDLAKTVLTPQAVRGLERLILTYAEAFVGQDGRLGEFQGETVHRIDLIDPNAINKQRPYQVPFNLRAEVEKQVNTMLEQGVIRPSNSPFSSPVVMVPKKDGSWRFAIDYRKLNANTRKEVYILPLISDILEEMGGKSIYTSMDLQSGFHQLYVQPEHIERTAFATFLGLFEFVRMPFGLCGAPNTFQRAMTEIKKDLSGATAIYIDDILLGSTTETEHLSDLQNLFETLIKYGLKLKLSKCTFGQAEVKYLGHLISNKGIRPDPKSIQAVTALTPPKTLTELRSFLGAASYFRRYIHQFAQLVSPLTDLTTKGESVQARWTDEAQKAFEEIKKRLITAPVLQTPRFREEFVIETDASATAISAVLLQKGTEDAHLHPIAFASRKLNKTEQKYHSTETEALAMLFGLRQYQAYVLGAPKTTIRTDNAPICSIFKKSGTEGRLGRFKVAIQSYSNVEIQHRSGKSNLLCDYLSRWPGEVNAIEEVSPYFVPHVTRMDIQKAQEEDEELQAQARGETDDLSNLQEGEFGRMADLVIQIQQGQPKIVIPPVLRQRIIKELHADILQGAHLGFARTSAKVRERFIWPQMARDIRQYVQQCHECQIRKVIPALVHREPLFPIPLSRRPLDRVHLDLMGPLPLTMAGNKYLMVLSDPLTKWLTAIPIPNKEAATITMTLVRQYISIFGIPMVIVTDNGREFKNYIFKALTEQLGVEHRFTTPYRPQTNGQVERANATLGNMMAHYTEHQGTNWDEIVSLVCYAYNTAKNPTTGTSPFELLYGRPPRLPLDTEVARQLPSMLAEIGIYPDHLAKHMEIAWRHAAELLNQEKEQMKGKHDTNVSISESLHVGDLVLKRLEQTVAARPHKFTPRYTGPYTIIKLRPPDAIIQQAPAGPTTRIHCGKLRRYFPHDPTKNGDNGKKDESSLRNENGRDATEQTRMTRASDASKRTSEAERAKKRSRAKPTRRADELTGVRRSERLAGKGLAGRESNP